MVSSIYEDLVNMTRVLNEIESSKCSVVCYREKLKRETCSKVDDLRATSFVDVVKHEYE